MWTILRTNVRLATALILSEKNSIRKYRQYSKKSIGAREYILMWYHSKVTRDKGGVHVALFWIYFDSEVRLLVKCEILK